jgi:predicted permease
MSAFIVDLRDALRGLRRDFGYVTTVTGILALTIGATTVVFSIVNGVLLKPLAFRESHRLVAVRETWDQLANRMPVLPVNEQHFEYWREHVRTFESLAQYIVLPANLTGSGDAAQIAVGHASGSLFDVLQVRAAIGRTLTADDERGDTPRVVTISDTLWRTRFGGDPAVLGRGVRLDGKVHTIVGVLPPDFRLPEGQTLSADVDAFIPIRMSDEQIGWVGDHNNAAIGRLRTGVSVETAEAELDVLQRQVSARATAEAHEPVTLGSYVVPLNESIVGRARRGLLLLFAAILAVLLIACANLANLSLTRALGRQRETAIRSALGAGRSRLLAHAMLEQLVLSLAGGALGVGITWVALRVFVRTAPVSIPRVEDVSLDARVLAFAAATSIVSGLVVALLPAWRVAGRDVQRALRAGSLTISGDRSGLRARSTLLALQVGLSVMLLVVTALLAVSFVRLVGEDRGFNASRVLAMSVSLPMNRYREPSSVVAAYDRLVHAVHALPGVDSVTTTSMLPLAGQGQTNSIAPEGNTRPRAELPTANFRFVAPEYFRTLGISILRGRTFAETERAPDRPMPALVSKSAAMRLWPAGDAIGKRFSRAIPGEQDFEVVGVAADARTTSLEEQPPLMVYLPYWRRPRTSMSLLVRSSVDPESLAASLRRLVRDIDPEIALGQAQPLQQLADRSLAGRRYQMRLFVAFGAVALIIATIGVYAVTSYTISRRRREMNIRVALGARRSQVLGLILRQSGAPVAAGLAGGGIGAVAIGSLVASLLFSVRPGNPAVILAVMATVGSVGAAACLVAARHGLNVDPAAALREE